MQKLEVFQSLWGMERKHPTEPERSHAENIAQIAEAGFAGVCLDPYPHELPYYRETLPLLEQYGLKCMVNLFPQRIEDMQALLEFAREAKAVKVNTIAQVMPVSVAGALPLLQLWTQQAQAMGFELLFETHRNGILNDLYYTLEVLDAMPELKLTADLSHFVVDREFPLPISARDQGFIQRIHERSECFQGRIATAEQVQIQIGFPQHQPWVAQFKTWWKQGMANWRQRSSDDATCVFLCELGPPPYAITGADGLELSDRWQEALTLKQWAEAIWVEVQSEVKP